MRTPRLLGPATVIGGWLSAAAVATAVTVLAVNAIGASIATQGPQPLTSAQVAQALKAAGPATEVASPAPSLSPTPSAPGQATGTRVLSTSGGTIVARCSGGRVTLLSWSPAQGYEADDVRRGPATHADLEFKSAGVELEVRVTCQGGSPVASAVPSTRGHDD